MRKLKAHRHRIDLIVGGYVLRRDNDSEDGDVVITETAERLEALVEAADEMLKYSSWQTSPKRRDQEKWIKAVNYYHTLRTAEEEREGAWAPE